MASPIKQVSMKCINMILMLLLLLLFTSTRGQPLHGEDGNRLLMMNIIDTLDTLSLQLKAQEAKVESLFEEQGRNLDAKLEALLEAHEVKMEAKLEAYKVKMEAKLEAHEVKMETKLEEQGRNLDAKMEALLEAHEIKMEAKLEGLQQCSTRDQVLEFQDLLATDECKEHRHNCSQMAECFDHRIDYSCTCLPGYSGDGFTCEDVDECSEKKETCSVGQICQNNPGTYTCVCAEGFEKEGDICQDVDECSENIDNCSGTEVCSNIPGSFTCHNCPKYLKKVGDICQVPVCESPSLWIPSLGCLKAVEEIMNWDAAKSKCQDLGMRLAEGISRKHMESLVQHFKPIIGGNWPWVGLRNGRWLTSGEEEEVSEEDWRGEGDPHGRDQQCGKVDMYPSVTGLADMECSGYNYVLCQSLP